MKIVRGGTLIDGTGADPVRDAAIVIDNDGRISAVTTVALANCPPDTELIDATGHTILPGLIDCHDHPALHGYELARRWGLDEPASTRTLRTSRILRTIVRSGYTTVRDAGGLDAGFKMAIDEGLIVGPRLQVSLNIVSPIGGVGDRVSPSGHQCLVPPDPTLPPGVTRGLDDVRNVVRTMVRSGADVIKCATTGAVSGRHGHGPKDGAFTLEEMCVLVEEAHMLDRRVMCHAIGGRGLRVAIEAGVDSVDHGSYLDEDPELIPMMVEKGTFFVPTLTVYSFHRESKVPLARERARALQGHHIDSIHRAIEAGVKVVAGTDAGGHGHPNNAKELEELVASGIKPMQAIRAATGLAAECIGLENDLGTLEKGKWADLVLVDGDPLADIRVLQDPKRIKLVMKGGSLVKRADAMERRQA